MKIPWRKNVLWLMIIAYAAVMAVFFGLIWKGAMASESYETIKEPLMALIGGTLALAKDLVPFGHENPSPADEPLENGSPDKKQ